MTKYKIIISKSEFLKSLIGWCVGLSPGNQCRNVGEIQEQAVILFDACSECSPSGFQFVELPLDRDEILKFIEQFINIPIIKELNLSWNEYNAGMRADDVEDPSRDKYYFVSSYDRYNFENDFVDLNALARNVLNSLLIQNALDMDCFRCSYNTSENIGCDECVPLNIHDSYMRYQKSICRDECEGCVAMVNDILKPVNVVDHSKYIYNENREVSL